MNAMNGSVPAQADLNWQMTGLFLLALVLLGFVMKLVALLVLQAKLSHCGLTPRRNKHHSFYPTNENILGLRRGV